MIGMDLCILNTVEQNKISDRSYVLCLINSSTKVISNQILNGDGRSVEVEAYNNNYYPLFENNLNYN